MPRKKQHQGLNTTSELSSLFNHARRFALMPTSSSHFGIFIVFPIFSVVFYLGLTNVPDIRPQTAGGLEDRWSRYDVGPERKVMWWSTRLEAPGHIIPGNAWVHAHRARYAGLILVDGRVGLRELTGLGSNLESESKLELSEVHAMIVAEATASGTLVCASDLSVPWWHELPCEADGTGGNYSKRGHFECHPVIFGERDGFVTIFSFNAPMWVPEVKHFPQHTMAFTFFMPIGKSQRPSPLVEQGAILSSSEWEPDSGTWNECIVPPTCALFTMTPTAFSQILQCEAKTLISEWSSWLDRGLKIPPKTLKRLIDSIEPIPNTKFYHVKEPELIVNLAFKLSLGNSDGIHDSPHCTTFSPDPSSSTHVMTAPSQVPTTGTNLRQHHVEATTVAHKATLSSSAHIVSPTTFSLTETELQHSSVEKTTQTTVSKGKDVQTNTQTSIVSVDMEREQHAAPAARISMFANVQSGRSEIM